MSLCVYFNPIPLPQDTVGTSLYEEKQKEAAEHEGKHLPAQPTPAWIEPGTTAKATTKATGDEPAATANTTDAESAAKGTGNGVGTTAEAKGAGSTALSSACIVFVLGGPGKPSSVLLLTVHQSFLVKLLGKAPHQ